MATPNRSGSTATSNLTPQSDASGPPMLSVAADCSMPKPTGFDSNEFDNKITQLRSLLTCMYGVGQEWVEVIGMGHRDNILWIAANLASEIDAMNSARMNEATVDHPSPVATVNSNAGRATARYAAACPSNQTGNEGVSTLAALKLARIALLTAEVTSGAIQRLMEEMDPYADPDQFPLAMAIEACLEKVRRDAKEASRQIDTALAFAVAQEVSHG